LLLLLLLFGRLCLLGLLLRLGTLQEAVTPDAREALEEHFGLNKPVVERYVQWLSQIFRGDLGRSWLTNLPVTKEIERRMPVTLEFLVLTMLLYIPAGIGIGVISAMRRNQSEDYGLRFFTIFMLAVPNFWLFTLAIILPLLWWGYSPSVPYSEIWDDPLRNLEQMIVPAAITAIASAALLARVTRSELLEVLRQDYMITARAKGLQGRTVVLRHALRNAMLPVITVIGLTIAGALAGSVIAEQIYNLPGVGIYLVRSLTNNDLPVVQSWMLLFGTAFILLNLVIDLSYSWLDPRIRFT
jgi:peptide/nickel transport system permease protein